jgi:hypothetical protein
MRSNGVKDPRSAQLSRAVPKLFNPESISIAPIGLQKPYYHQHGGLSMGYSAGEVVA